MSETVKQTSKEEIRAYYRSIGMPVPAEKLHEVDVGSHIVQHYIHSYDEHGNVIVVEDEKEDLWQSIPQYQNEVGPKNIIRMIESGADPVNLLNANRENAVYGDFSDMDAKSVNAFKDIVEASSANAVKALEEFNKKFGTSLDMKSFLDLYQKGLLGAHVEGVNNTKTEVIDNGEK